MLYLLYPKKPQSKLMRYIYPLMLLTMLQISLYSKNITHTWNSNIEIINININNIPNCDNYKKIKENIFTKSITLPKFGYNKKTKTHDKLLGTTNEILKLKNKYFVCKKENIIILKHVNILDMEIIK